MKLSRDLRQLHSYFAIDFVGAEQLKSSPNVFWCVCYIIAAYSPFEVR